MTMPDWARIAPFLQALARRYACGMKAPQLSEKAVQDFKAIFRKEFGRDISDDEAMERGLWLLNFLKILLEPNANADDR
jgi:hypothetical protein